MPYKNKDTYMPDVSNIRILCFCKRVNCGYCGIALLLLIIVKLIKELAYHFSWTPARRLSYNRSRNLYV